MKTRITEEDYYKYFDYATSARENCYDFCSSPSISAKDFVRSFYYHPTKKLVKTWLNYYGVKGTKVKIRRILQRFTNDGLPKFR